MDIFGICICPEHIQEVVFGAWPVVTHGLLWVDLQFRRFGRFFT